MYDSVFTDSSVSFFGRCATMKFSKMHRDHVQVAVALADIFVRTLFNWGAA